MTHRFAIPSAEVLQAREKLVLDHFHDEVRQDWEQRTRQHSRTRTTRSSRH